MGMKPTWSFAAKTGRLVGGQLAVHAPVGLLHVLEDDVHLLRRGLADPDHRFGDGGGDLALLLRGASGVPLHGDVRHGVPSCGLLESLHVRREIRRERIRLDGAVRVEPHREVLRLLRAPAALPEEPAPGRIAAVDADLVRLAVEALELRLARLAHRDGFGLRRRKLAAERGGEASSRDPSHEKRSGEAGRTHGTDYPTRHSARSTTRRRPHRPAPRACYDTAVETFTAAERAALAPYFTDLDGPVFALVNLPEVVKGALFARYSRSPKSLRRLFLDEFLRGDAGVGAAGAEVAETARRRAEQLYERVFVEYGDDSVA